MNSTALMSIAEKTFDRVRALRATKGKDYAGEDDALKNFKEAASGLGVGPMTIWTVYAHKHWSAIVSYCKNGQSESEPIGGRIDDLITYLILLKGLIAEANGDEPVPALVGERSRGPRDPRYRPSGEHGDELILEGTVPISEQRGGFGGIA